MELVFRCVIGEKGFCFKILRYLFFRLICFIEMFVGMFVMVVYERFIFLISCCCCGIVDCGYIEWRFVICWIWMFWDVFEDICMIDRVFCCFLGVWFLID